MPWLPSTFCGLYLALLLAGVLVASTTSRSDGPLAGRRDLCGAEGTGEGMCCCNWQEGEGAGGGGTFSLFAELLGDGVDLQSTNPAGTDSQGTLASMPHLPQSLAASLLYEFGACLSSRPKNVPRELVALSASGFCGAPHCRATGGEHALTATSPLGRALGSVRGETFMGSRAESFGFERLSLPGEEPFGP
jgi:hypothetical protein